MVMIEGAADLGQLKKIARSTSTAGSLPVSRGSHSKSVICIADTTQTKFCGFRSPADALALPSSIALCCDGISPASGESPTVTLGCHEQRGCGVSDLKAKFPDA